MSTPMSNDNALYRTTHGGTVLVFDVPPGFEFGIDCTIFSVGEKFAGVKMIPPGLHLVLLGAPGNDVTRVAEFVMVNTSDVVVRKWDPTTETFAVGSGYDAEQTERLAIGARQHDFDSSTGPYPTESLEIWTRLTSHINENVLSSCGVPLGTRVAPGDPDQPLEAHTRLPETTEAARRRARNVSAENSSTNTSDVPVAPSFGDSVSRAPLGVSPETITKLGFDPEARLKRAVDESHAGDWSAFLGANQTAFVLFLLLGSEPALMFWKTSTALLCDASSSCTTKERLELYSQFTASLAAQLDRATETLFSDEDLEDMFLRKALVALCGGLKQALGEGLGAATNPSSSESIPPKLKQEVTRRRILLEKWTVAKFGVDVAAEYEGKRERTEGHEKTENFPFGKHDEDAPVVVELPEGTFMRMEGGEDVGEDVSMDNQSSETTRMGWMVQ